MRDHKKSLDLLDKFLNETSKEELDAILKQVDGEDIKLKKSLYLSILAIVLQVAGYAAIWYLLGWKVFLAVAFIHWGQNIVIKYVK